MAGPEALSSTDSDSETCKQVKSTKGTSEHFLKSVSVWINKPHVVNRRLCGSKIVAVKRSESKEEIDKAVDEFAEIYDEKKLRSADLSFKDLSEENSSFTLLIRELIPKSDYFPNILEAVLYDKTKCSVSFIPIRQEKASECKEKKKTSELKYAVSFSQLDEAFPEWAQLNEITLSWACDHDMGNDVEVQRQMTSQWLRTHLLEKLVNWSHINDISTAATSLQLVAVDKYKEVYVRLKNTYGRDLVKNWTESTDPKKFVYEDVAIAAYLLLIWSEDREKKNLQEKQSFVDLGCGNGLLVYILTKEGHRGLGIDLRKRKIWDTFGPGINLKEETITPSAEHLFPDYDWIIGNHSDELTPWIPVITARSSYNCSFFLLPCCHHDFIGKFASVDRGKSHYASYLKYVEDIVYNCGFNPECDTLRIPSTKRICYLGRQRSYEEQDEAVVDRDRQAFIDRRTAHIETLSRSRNSNKKLTQQNAERATLPSSVANVARNDDSNESMQRLTSSHSEGDQHMDSQNVEDVNSDSYQTHLRGHKRKALQGDGQSSDLDVTCNGSVVASEVVKKVKGGLDCDSEVEGKVICLQNHVNSCDSTTERERGAENRNSSEQMKSNEDKMSVEDVKSGKTESSQWAADFAPRVEGGVRNCQRVCQETKTRIVAAVFQKVLTSEEETVSSSEETGKSWRKGGAVPLGQVVQLFDKLTLQELKAECGGLQTLLRNHSHIFQVTGGVVRLRDFTSSDPWEGRKPKKVKNQERQVKTTRCWFYDNHPDSCPRPAQLCTFAHGEAELRQRNEK